MAPGRALSSLALPPRVAPGAAVEVKNHGEATDWGHFAA